MHIYTWKLIRVAIDYARHSCKVVRNLLRIRVDNQVVIAGNVFQEIAIVCVVACQRRELYQVLPVVGLLFPEVELVVR